MPEAQDDRADAPAAAPLSYATPEPAGGSRFSGLALLGFIAVVAWPFVTVAALNSVQPGLPLLVLLPTLPAAAFALGAAARSSARREDADGRARGTAIMLAGGIELALLLAAAVILPNLGRPREAAQRVKCASNLRQIGQAVQMYANDHGGAFPPTPHLLITHADLGTEVFCCPSTDAERAKGPTTAAAALAFRSDPRHSTYVYLAAGLSSASATPEHVLAHDLPQNHVKRGHPSGINVLFGDGTVQWVAQPAADRLLAELAAGHNPPRTK